MKESNTLAANVNIKHLQGVILLNTTREYMKESNTLAVNANIEQLLGVILRNITKEYMKESNTLAGNAANISLSREVWIYTKGQ